VNHSEHYPTFIENPKTGQRALVKTPWDHHRQLLGWKMDGLDPEPDPPAELTELRNQGPADPDYPKWIEHPKSGQRVLVANRQAEKDQLESWIAKKAPVARKPEPVPPPQPLKGTARASTSMSSAKGASKATGKQPPTVEELIAKNYQPSVAQRMVDEEIRKFNAGEAPYNQD
jgi:hypothetical protein